MSKVLSSLRCGIYGLDQVGAYLGLLSLRLLLAYEFWEAGVEKYKGTNWFADIAEKFPFPFNVIPVDVSWALATWFEMLGAVALVIGLGTRFFSLSLMILTVVAIAAVHWPAEWHGLAQLWQGYAIEDAGHGNYKLPLIYLVMFVPLLLSGPGKLSLDYWIAKKVFKD